MHHEIAFHGHRLHAMPSGALYWPAQALLCVSDLHFGKSERLARRAGSLLPPYETRDTLTRLDADITATAARSGCTPRWLAITTVLLAIGVDNIRTMITSNWGGMGSTKANTRMPSAG